MAIKDKINNLKKNVIKGGIVLSGLAISSDAVADTFSKAQDVDKNKIETVNRAVGDRFMNSDAVLIKGVYESFGSASLENAQLVERDGKKWVKGQSVDANGKTVEVMRTGRITEASFMDGTKQIEKNVKDGQGEIVKLDKKGNIFWKIEQKQGYTPVITRGDDVSILNPGSYQTVSDSGKANIGKVNNFAMNRN